MAAPARKRPLRPRKNANDSLLLKALIAQNQITSKLFELESYTGSDSLPDEEVKRILAKNKADVLVARKYVHGQPFLVDEYLEECNSSCRKLHKYCMDAMSEGHKGLLVHYDGDHFGHNQGSISVEFEDFHLCFNFDVLSITLVKVLDVVSTSQTLINFSIQGCK